MSDQAAHPLFSLLRSGAKAFFATGDELPSSQDLDAFEQLVGWTLPPEYRAFQERYGALYVEAIADVWPRPAPYQVGPAWSFNYGFVVLGLGKSVPDWMDARHILEGFRQITWHDKLMPVSHRVVGDGSLILFDPGHQLVRWDPATQDLEPLGMSFDALLENEVRNLMENMAKIQEPAETTLAKAP